ncbi:MAG: ribosome recycling factor [Candidatus Competibacteraceae bacterium]|nr:ribosome recycling factor [Candidatus Competibacteraceae bacterium]
MSKEAVVSSAKDMMNKAIAHLEAELVKIRTGKAMPNMLDSVMVDYYGSMTPLSQIANINTPDARTLVIQPWEKNKLQDIERAIINSNLGLAPQNDGAIIRITVPPLTEERRKDMVKIAKSQGEDSKISIRNARRDSIEQIKKLQKDGLSEDIAKDAENTIQQITNDFIAKVDEHVNKKEKEIMTV